MNNVETYNENIEAIIVENIFNAVSSIRIIMAWFTSKTIKDALIDLKIRKPNVVIEIVVDNNEINDKYFLDYREKFQAVGIVICEKVIDTFLHSKILLIDSMITITGSYNYSNKAKKNFENIVIISNERVNSTNSRLFEFLTVKDYIDENISLLFKYPEFSQSLIWSYYNFSISEYKKYKGKMIIGDCFTHENGFYDEIKYYPGFIFNKKVKFEKKIKPSEFPLPITKRIIQEWVKGRNDNLILDYYADKENEYEYINDDLFKNETAVKRFFEKKISNTYTCAELEKYIIEDIDIIKEDYLWACNFSLFLTKDIVEKLFDIFSDNKEPISYPKGLFE